MVRRRIRRRFLRHLTEKTDRPDLSLLERSTLVLAPHPDDETLGCGGLTAILRDRRVPVHIAFMTDGAASHPGDDSAALAQTRRVEARSAAATLGVGEDHLTFLDHPDGGLTAESAAAERELGDLLDSFAPDQIVLPHPLEPHPDHRATYDVAAAATKTAGLECDALLYGVWLWDQWPWTNPLAPPRERHGRTQIVEVALRGGLGTTPLRRFDVAIDITAVLDRKRDALERHQSQVGRPEDQPDRLTLSDVADGDWLDLLLQPTEFYERARLGASGTPVQ